MRPLAERELVPVHKSGDIRFLTVVFTLNRGGTERAAMNYALGYRQAGYRSAVLAYGGGGPRQAQLEAEGVEVFVGGSEKAQILDATDQARAWNPDIVHLNRGGQTERVSASVVRQLLHAGMRVLETNVFGYADRSADRMMIDLHLHLSRWSLWKWSQSTMGLRPQPLGLVLPYSIDCDAFRAVGAEEKNSIRGEFGIPENALVYGRVGQPDGAKWSPVLIQAFEAVAMEIPNAWLAVCGMPDQLKKMADDLPASIRSHVVALPLTNFDRELRRYYGLMDVFVHAANKGESFGMVLCEAMLLGVPVITLSTPLRDNSQIEVVPHRKAGIVVRNLREMIQAMLRCAKPSRKFEEMQKLAPKCVRERFDIGVITPKLVELASIALGAGSRRELASRLSEIPGLICPAPQRAYREILESAGVTLSFRDVLLTPLINRPTSRSAINFARSIESHIR
jgi:hypothetical protein